MLKRKTAFEYFVNLKCVPEKLAIKTIANIYDSRGKCKNCEYWEKDYCNQHSISMTKKDYCSKIKIISASKK